MNNNVCRIIPNKASGSVIIYTTVRELDGVPLLVANPPDANSTTALH